MLFNDPWLTMLPLAAHSAEHSTAHGLTRAARRQNGTAGTELRRAADDRPMCQCYLEIRRPHKFLLRLRTKRSNHRMNLRHNYLVNSCVDPSNLEIQKCILISIQEILSEEMPTYSDKHHV
jgi:hypothetical protein